MTPSSQCSVIIAAMSVRFLMANREIRMKRDIDEHGYCLVKEALTPEQLAEARERLSEQAAAERTLERKRLTYAYQT